VRGATSAVLVKSQGPRGEPRDPGSDQTRPKSLDCGCFGFMFLPLLPNSRTEVRGIGFAKHWLSSSNTLFSSQGAPPHSLLLTRPGPLRPDRVWAQKNRRHQASGQSDPASRRKVLVFGSPSVQFSEVFTHVGMRPWVSLSYIRLNALSTGPRGTRSPPD
jgi:hypothetical protein